MMITRFVFLPVSVQLVVIVMVVSASSILNTKLPQQQQQQQQQPTTSTTTTPLPPTLLSSLAKDNLQQLQQQQSHKHSEGVKQRSTNVGGDEVGDMVATVNNHSRNQQAPLRPPQYVDVSALMSSSTRNLTSISGGGGGGGNSPGANSQPSVASAAANSQLSPKSRSGLPECATQQVCNAIFVRMNHTQRLCECSSNYNWKCSNNLDPQDGHTIELTRKFDKRVS